MSKELTEKWRNCTLPNGVYYLQYDNCLPFIYNSYQMIDLKKCKDSGKVEVLAPVPSYRDLYGENDGNMPTGVFTVLKIIKRDIENAQKRRSLTDLECGIKSQVVSLLKKWGVE